jgi:hypothetical protein
MACIRRDIIEKLKAGVRSGEISLSKLYEMTSSEERRAVFEKFVPTEEAKAINASFEQAMASKQKKALTNWVAKTFTTKERSAGRYKTVVDHIQEINKIGPLNPENANDFLSDMVSKKLGASVTPEEFKIITQKADKLEELYNNKTEFGVPETEYWVAKNNIEKYIQSLTPTHNLKVATSISGRGAMLASIKSPLTNIISNTVNGGIQGLQRRVSSGTYKGLNGDFAVAYAKKVNEIYQKSGYDISRMEHENYGQRRLGETSPHSQGPGLTRKIGRFYEDVVFKQLMGAPDVVSSSIAFADAANLASTKIAQQEGLTGKEAKDRALEIFKDSTSITPQTAEGELTRSQALADAQYSTYTNKSGYSDLAMSIRTAINKATGDVRLGDQLMPFVKTPANVVQAGVDAAGLGAIKGFFQLKDSIRDLKAGNPAPMRETVNNFVKSGLGLTLATILAYATDPDDFVGDYDSLSSKEKSLTALKNAPYNSVKMGGKWVSLDYLGPLAAPYIGILYARKYGDNLPEKIFQYGKGAGAQSLRMPGLREFADLITDVKDAVKRGDLGRIEEGLSDEAVAYIRSRVVPAIVNDFAKGIDPYERATGGKSLSKAIASIPVARETLPVKTSQITGEPLKSENFVSTMLFGSRLKTPIENDVLNEINRLYGENAAPAISDIRYGKRMQELSKQIGEAKFNEAISYYGKLYGNKSMRTISTPKYKSSVDEEKMKMLNKNRDEALDEALRKFGYKKQKNLLKKRD